MTALEFLKTRGDAETEALAIRAGTTLAYFKQIAYRHRRPSADLAKRLEAESFGAMKAADLVFVDLKQPGEREDADAAAAAEREEADKAAEILLRNGPIHVARA